MFFKNFYVALPRASLSLSIQPPQCGKGREEEGDGVEGDGVEGEEGDGDKGGQSESECEEVDMFGGDEASEKDDGGAGNEVRDRGDDDGHKFEVQSWPTKVVVNLGIQSCTCRFWELTGMPCMHAIAAIVYKNERPEDHCHAWLTMASYQATYANHIEALPGQDFWVHTDQIPPVPPKIKKKVGRPKKQRRKENHEEPVNPTKLKRKIKEVKCSVCGDTNHNRQTCVVEKRQRLAHAQAGSAGASGAGSAGASDAGGAGASHAGASAGASHAAGASVAGQGGDVGSSHAAFHVVSDAAVQGGEVSLLGLLNVAQLKGRQFSQQLTHDYSPKARELAYQGSQNKWLHVRNRTGYHLPKLYLNQPLELSFGFMT
ncbi:hypothetical protein VNO77_20275 [Canavalia gladiata]|uniref:SWIM-type domain-containing protein n=1 Tax=Canavalia gladiata TaxID=3824 RepID=A0AAN9LP52_CANGL